MLNFIDLEKIPNLRCMLRTLWISPVVNDIKNLDAYLLSEEFEIFLSSYDA